MLSVLVDTNIALDFCLAREGWGPAAREIFLAAKEGRLRAVLPATSLKDVYYVARKAAGAEVAKRYVEYFLDICQIGSVSDDVCRMALEEREPDFEDGIVAAVAREQAVDIIVSRGEHAFLNACAPKIDSRLFVDFFLRANADALFFEAGASGGAGLRELEGPSGL